MNHISNLYSRPAPADASYHPEPIPPLTVPETVEGWYGTRGKLLEAWQGIIGHPEFRAFDQSAERIAIFEQPNYTGTIYKQPTTPNTRQTVLLMTPHSPVVDPCPGMVVPFYSPDTMAGIDIWTREALSDIPYAIQFGRHLATLGFTVVCSEAYPYNTVLEPVEKSGMNWWQSAADRLRVEHPHWSGVGRLAWDASRALDLLRDQPGVDSTRCGIIGHSLGGKIAFYAAAFETRFNACIGSDFGIGFDFSNWHDDWYLGNRIHSSGFTRAHHELLALIAPRSFFLLGGSADRPASWHYIREAQRVYALYGRERAAGFLHHAAGHRPTDEAMGIAYSWLAEQFGLDLTSAIMSLFSYRK